MGLMSVVGGRWAVVGPNFKLIRTEFADVSSVDDSNGDDLNWLRLVGGACGKVEPELRSMQRRR